MFVEGGQVVRGQVITHEPHLNSPPRSSTKRTHSGKAKVPSLTMGSERQRAARRERKELSWATGLPLWATEKRLGN